MKETEIELYPYQAESGKEPFTLWMGKLSEAARGKVRARLNLLRLGHFGDCKPVGNGVEELRFFASPGFRIYFGRDGKKVIILLAGGKKDTQKSDIAKADRYWSDYLSD